MNSIYAGLPNTIFDVMSNLARDLNAINLGQGFPDDPGPEDVRRKAADEVLNGWNQYPPMMGLPVLRQAIADHFNRFQNLNLDAMTETMVTSGATEAIADAILAVIEPGTKSSCFSRCTTPICRLCSGRAASRSSSICGRPAGISRGKISKRPSHRRLAPSSSTIPHNPCASSIRASNWNCWRSFA